GCHARMPVCVAVHQMPNAGARGCLRERAQRRPAFEARTFRVDKDGIEVIKVPQRIVAPRIGLAPQVEHLGPLHTLLSGLDAETNRVRAHVISFRGDDCAGSSTTTATAQRGYPRAPQARQVRVRTTAPAASNSFNPRARAPRNLS